MTNLVALFIGMAMLISNPVHMDEVTTVYSSVGSTNTKYEYVNDELVGVYEYDFETEDWIEVID
jgi:hypothetical protein